MYKCFSCGHELTAKDIERRTICPYCGFRIVSKNRPNVVKLVKAR